MGCTGGQVETEQFEDRDLDSTPPLHWAPTICKALSHDPRPYFPHEHPSEAPLNALGQVSKVTNQGDHCFPGEVVLVRESAGLMPPPFME